MHWNEIIAKRIKDTGKPFLIVDYEVGEHG
jgi:hypothetical protein